MKFKAENTPVEGLKLIECRAFEDPRGYFLESYNRKDFARMGIDMDFVQDNHVHSRRGTLRGLHFQKLHPQAKLVRVIRGEVYDVSVDLRRSSRSFEDYHGQILSAANRRQLFVPAGFAHGYLVLSEEAELVYKCSDFYFPEDEGGLLWNDPDLGIEWPRDRIDGPLLSEKDRKLPALRELDFRFP